MPNSSPHPLLAGFPVVIPIDVAWAEMDAFRHLNHIAFLRYAESGRVAFFRSLGFFPSGDAVGVAPIMHSLSCRYKASVTFPDRVQVGTRAEEIGEDRFVARFRIVSETQNLVVVEGTALAVSFDYGRNQKAPIPEAVLLRLAELHR